MKINILLMGFVLISGCSTIPNNNFNSTLWIQTSSEYKANSIQVFNNASYKIVQSLNDPNWSAAIEQDDDDYSSLPVAVVMDIDETVLDNSSYQAELILQGSEYNDDTWDSWIRKRKAPIIPGALGFIRKAKSKNIETIFITNRECKPRKDDPSPCPQEADTIANLNNVGITGVSPKNIYLKNEEPGWGPEKKSRRKIVAEAYRILMLFGDDIGDFISDVKKNITYEERANLVTKYEDNWGSIWFMLTNPTYGSWLRVLNEPKSQYLRGY